MAVSTSGKARGLPVVGVLVAEGDGMPPGLGVLGSEADLRLTHTTEELAEIIGDAEALCVWEFREPRLAKVWGEAQRLQWVHAASAGVDAIVFPELTDSDVVVTNTRGVLDDAIAEWVLACLLAFVKDLPTTLALQRRRRWRHRETERIAGRRVVVVGAGSIGRSVARLCTATGMRVDGVARRARRDDPDFGTVTTAAGMHDLLAGTDFLVVCAPLTEHTRGLVGAAELAALPRGARLVNVGRGPVVDEGALVEALESGHLAGAALDVFGEEPLPRDHRFWDMEQVIVSPHMAGDFVGWQQAFSEVFVDNFRRWRAGEPLLNVVDVHDLVAGA